MKASLIAVTLLLPAVAMAGQGVRQDTVEYGRVLSSTPISSPPVARQVCHPVTVEQPAEHSTAGAILGGLTGALVGSRFGGGHGQDAVTVAGAIGGAMVGDRVGASSGTVTREQCDTTYEQGPPSGYQVTFEYEGQRQTVTMNHSPGDYVKVHKVVTVE